MRKKGRWKEKCMNTRPGPNGSLDLRKRLDAIAKAPSPEILEAISKGEDHILHYRALRSYSKVDPSNPRMRAIFKDALYSGLWRLLWMPPSMPYTIPAGHYAEVDSVTKFLVFSSWNAVPNAIASLCSYEAERRMLEGLDIKINHDELYSHVSPLLRFSRDGDGRLTGMPALAILVPFPALARAIDPLKIALQEGGGQSIGIERLLAVAEQKCHDLLQDLPPGQTGARADERWYWAALALLETKSGFANWCLQKDGLAAIGEEQQERSAFAEHMRELAAAISGHLPLGPRPKDLARVMAEIAIGGPGCCALRALHRIADDLPLDDPDLLTAAASIGSGFRPLFNLPETIALLRGGAEAIYWRLVLQYCREGNLQAVLDEQVHVLLESAGLKDHTSAEKLAKIEENLADVLSMRTARIKIDEIRADTDQIRLKDFTTRCRFALRFGDLQDEKDSIVARADTVRQAFNSPFGPFILASTSIGQEGLDYHTWCPQSFTGICLRTPWISNRERDASIVIKGMQSEKMLLRDLAWML